MNSRTRNLDEFNRLSLRRRALCSQIDAAIKTIHISFDAMKGIHLKQQNYLSELHIPEEEWEHHHDALLEAIVQDLAYPNDKFQLASVDTGSTLRK